MGEVVITGVSGLGNRGVEALVTTTIRELRARRPGLRITVVSRNAEADAPRLERHDVRVVAQPGPDRPRKRPRGRRKRWRLAIESRLRGRDPISLAWRPVDAAFREAALVVATGGDVFGPSHEGFRNHLEPLLRAQALGRPVCFLAQSIGPFSSEEDAQAWSAVARKAVVTTIREETSLRYVTDTLGVRDRVSLTADPAFLLDVPGPSVLVPLRRAYGVDGRRPTVALAVSQGITGFVGMDDTRHMAALEETARTVLDDLGARLLLVAHVQEQNARIDDRVLARALYERLGGDPRVALTEGLGASEMKGLIGGCELVVAERMHAAIAGLSSGVATVALEYSVKAGGIMRQVFGDDAGEPALLRVERFTEPGRPREVVRAAWEARATIAAGVRARLPEVRQLAARNFELIDGILAPGVGRRGASGRAGRAA